MDLRYKTNDIVKTIIGVGVLALLIASTFLAADASMSATPVLFRNANSNSLAETESAKSFVQHAASRDLRHDALFRGNPKSLIPGAIVGVVYDSVTFCPILDATMTLDEFGLNVGTTDFQGGSYVVLAIPEGSYTLSCSAPGYLTTTRQVSVFGSFIVQVSFVLDRIAGSTRITGLVKDAFRGLPLSGVRVEASVTNEAVTSINTSFCRAGQYDLVLPAKATNITLKFVSDKYEEKFESVEVTKNVDTSLTPKSVGAGIIAGVVSNSDTHLPIPGAQVAVLARGGVVTNTNERGEYILSELPEDTYTLLASAGGSESKLNVVVSAISIENKVDFELDFTGSGPGPSDVDGDGEVSATDVQFTINAALGIVIGELDADIDDDGYITAVDVQKVINSALGLKRNCSTCP